MNVFRLFFYVWNFMCRNRGALTAGNEALGNEPFIPVPNGTVFCVRTNVFLFSRENYYILMNAEQNMGNL